MGGDKLYNTELVYENYDGSMKKLKVLDYVDRILKDLGKRYMQLHVAFLGEASL